MFHLIKSGARRVLGPRLTAAVKRLSGRRAPVKAPPVRGPGAVAAEPNRAAEPVPPADPPRKLLFLSDCYAADVVWGPFHRSMLAYCGAAFERVLAIRTNAFFRPWSHEPLSPGQLAQVQREISAFAPDLIFSINRAGLSGDALAGVHPSAKAITVFIDYYDRLDDSMHRYGPRDLVWVTGTGRAQRDFLHKYGGRLRPDQTVFTAWGVDHNLFHPRGLERTTGIIFVGTPFNPERFVNLLDLLDGDEDNRRAFLRTYEAHREQFIFDWRAALRSRGFDFGRLGPHAAPHFGHAELHQAVCDQVSIENRITCLAALAGLDVKLYGDSNRQWIQDFSIANARMLKHFQFRAVTDPAELANLYCSSRLGINIQHDHARDAGLSFRAYDLLACQTLLLSHRDSWVPLADQGFTEGEDYVGFDDPSSLRQKCEYYLAHEEQRRAIAEAGARKVRARHTLAHRLAEVYGHFGYPAQAGCYEGLSRGDIHTLLDADRVLREKVMTLEPLRPRVAA
jgi:hypothetical protein